jgi:hypothetical protein
MSRPKFCEIWRDRSNRVQGPNSGNPVTVRSHRRLPPLSLQSSTPPARHVMPNFRQCQCQELASH